MIHNGQSVPRTQDPVPYRPDIQKFSGGVLDRSIHYIPCIYVPCSMCGHTIYYVCIYRVLYGKKAKSCNILQYNVYIGDWAVVLMYNIDKGQGFCYNCIIIIRTANTYR